MKDITYVFAGRPNSQTVNSIRHLHEISPTKPKITLVMNSTPNGIHEYKKDPFALDEFESIIKDVQNLCSVHVVDDPGELNDDNLRNINRRLACTHKGLEMVDTEYTLLCRPDVFIKDRTYESIWNWLCGQPRSPEYNVFAERIIISHLFTVNPPVYTGKLFHPGDFFYIGLTSDIRKLWNNIPYLKNEEICNSNRQTRFVSEQYIWLSCLQKFFPEVKLPYHNYADSDLFLVSLKSLINNFYFMTSTPNDSIYSTKHASFDRGPAFYDSDGWLKLNNYLCEIEG